MEPDGVDDEDRIVENVAKARTDDQQFPRLWYRLLTSTFLGI